MVTKPLLTLWADANGANRAAVIKVMAKIAKGKVLVFFIFLLPLRRARSARPLSESLMPHLLMSR